MIIDTLKNWKTYQPLSDRLQLAFEALEKTDFSTVQPGRIDLKGDEVFMLVQEYEAKEHSICRLEAHRKYMDIQYVVSGEEYMGVVPLESQELEEDYTDRDVAFYKGEATLMHMTPGMFALLYPQDLHQPGMKTERGGKVKKIVVKIQL